MKDNYGDPIEVFMVGDNIALAVHEDTEICEAELTPALARKLAKKLKKIAKGIE